MFHNRNSFLEAEEFVNRLNDEIPCNLNTEQNFIMDSGQQFLGERRRDERWKEWYSTSIYWS